MVNWDCGGLDDQAARADHAGQFGIAKLLQQAEHIAVNRLFPKAIAILEITAHTDCLMRGSRRRYSAGVRLLPN